MSSPWASERRSVESKISTREAPVIFLSNLVRRSPFVRFCSLLEEKSVHDSRDGFLIVLVLYFGVIVEIDLTHLGFGNLFRQDLKSSHVDLVTHRISPSLVVESTVQASTVNSRSSRPIDPNQREPADHKSSLRAQRE